MRGSIPPAGSNPNIDMNELFFELIRVALGNADKLSHIPNPDEWQTLYDMAKKQSLVSICFAGGRKPLSNSPLKGRENLRCGLRNLGWNDLQRL